MLKRMDDLHSGNGRQRKALRVAIEKTFSARELERFLDEELNIDYHGIVARDNDDNMAWEMISSLTRRGMLNKFVDRWIDCDEFGSSPLLKSVLETWATLAEEQPAQADAERNGQATEQLLVLPSRTQFERGRSAIPAVPSAPQDKRQRGRVDDILEGHVARMPAQKWLKGLAALAHQVCSIEVGDARGTGFLVGPQHVMTTAYLVDSSGLALDSMRVVFADGRSEGVVLRIDHVVSIDPEEGSTRRVGEDELFASLDFALLKLSKTVPPVDGRSRGWFDLNDRRSRLHPGEALMTLSNSFGGGLSMSQGSLAYPPEMEGRFAHDAETHRGSGGAPVFDSRLRLIGIHETGIADETGSEFVNIAIRADAIAQRLEARGVRLPKPPVDN